MLDVESHFLGLKTSWFDRIVNAAGNWAFLANRNLEPCLHCMRYMHFSTEHKLPDLERVPAFNKQILLAHAKAGFIAKPLSREDVLGQFLCTR